jgi:hypothetical protein
MRPTARGTCAICDELAEAEVAAPARQIDGQPPHRPLQARAFGAPRQRPNPAGEPGQRLRRDPTARVGLAGEAEAEKLARTGACHRALRRVDLQFETAAQEAFDTRHDPVALHLPQRVFQVVACDNRLPQQAVSGSGPLGNRRQSRRLMAAVRQGYLVLGAKTVRADAGERSSPT